MAGEIKMPVRNTLPIYFSDNLSPVEPEPKRLGSPGNPKLQTTNYKQIQNTKVQNSKQKTKAGIYYQTFRVFRVFRGQLFLFWSFIFCRKISGFYVLMISQD